MRYFVFSALSAVVRILPKMWKRDMLNLNKPQQALIGFKMWVTYNYLEERKKRQS